MPEAKKTLVIGASDNPSRYSYMAINKLHGHGHPVIGIGNRKGMVGDMAFSKERPDVDDIDTVTLYLNPKRQEEYYDYILSLNPERIIFNPGTENSVLEDMAKEEGIKVMKACTLVLLSTGMY